MIACCIETCNGFSRPLRHWSNVLLLLCYAAWLQDQASQSLGTFTAEPESGSIPAKGSKTVTLNLQAVRLGRIQLPVYVRVAGSRNKPLQLVADAKAQGPWLEFALKPKAARAASSCESTIAGEASSITAVNAAASEAGALPAPAASGTLDGCSSSLSALHAEVSSASQLTSASGTKRKVGRKSKVPKEPVGPQWAAGASIKFDKVQVLQSHSQQLLLRNPTLIDAEVKLFVEGRDSVYEVRPAALRLQAIIWYCSTWCVVHAILCDDVQHRHKSTWFFSCSPCTTVSLAGL